METTKQKKSSNGRTGSRYHTGGKLPIDLALLELLPDEGKMLGFKPIALQVMSIKEQPGFEGIDPTQIAGRLKAMESNKLAASQVVFPVHKGLGWQRTAKGRDLLAKNGKVVAV